MTPIDALTPRQSQRLPSRRCQRDCRPDPLYSQLTLLDYLCNKALNHNKYLSSLKICRTHKDRL